MKFKKTKINGLYIIEPQLFIDKRGYFTETYNSQIINNFLGKIDFIQDNESFSKRGVLRGLHFQTPPYSQSKLIKCNEGEILDVAVDIRKNSVTYGKYSSVLLSKKNKKQIFIPTGFAHGFIVLSDYAIISYKVDSPYKSNHESGILWNDNDINIDWKTKEEDIIISDKDKNLLPLSKINSPF